MTNSEINICSIIIGEDVKVENASKDLDIDFHIENALISGQIKVSKSSKKFLINLINVSDKKFDLNLEILLNEESFLELRDESDYNFGAGIIFY